MFTAPLAIASALTLALATPVLAAEGTPGSLDTTFTIGLGPSSPRPPSAVQAVLVQPDAKVLVGGFFKKFGTITVNGITRLNADGTQDPTFAVGTGTGIGSVSSLALQADGKILVGGTMVEFNGLPAHGIVRLNADGSVDPTFVQGTGFNDQVFDVEVQPDGKIMVAGAFTQYNAANAVNVVRLLPNGDVDPTFTSARVYDPTTGIDRILVQSDGKYVFAGSLRAYGDATVNGLVRVNPDGTRDASFNVGEGAGPYIFDEVSSILQQGDKYIIGGSFPTFNGVARPYLARLTSSGAVDPTFGAEDLGPNKQVNDLVGQSNGKLIVIGNFTKVGNQQANGIIRLTKDGKVDPTFVTGTGFNAPAASAALQNTKVIVGGFFAKYNGATVNQLVRIDSGSLPDGTLLDQTATVKVPSKLKKTGKTFLLTGPVLTNADQTATAKVTWSTKKAARGSSTKWANAKTTKAGKVSITTKGTAKRLFVRLTLTAPQTEFYKAYSYVKKWTVK